MNLFCYEHEDFRTDSLQNFRRKNIVTFPAVIAGNVRGRKEKFASRKLFSQREKEVEKRGKGNRFAVRAFSPRPPSPDRIQRLIFVNFAFYHVSRVTALTIARNFFYGDLSKQWEIETPRSRGLGKFYKLLHRESTGAVHRAI